MDEGVPPTQPCPAALAKAGSARSATSAGSDVASLPPPHATASAEPAGDDEDQEGKLKKLEGAGTSLLKSGRELLRTSSQIVEKKPYLEGKHPFRIAQHIYILSMHA